MATSLARDIFDRLLEQIGEVVEAADSAEAGGSPSVASAVRRSGYVLTVAALDSYFHERGIQLLVGRARSGTGRAQAVANYLQSVSGSELQGQYGESHIRLRLSFKTLASPNAIDGLLSAAGLDATAKWLSVSFALNSRPDRVRRLLDLLYDRRNQIAHEADWDVGRLDFRPMAQAHLSDCLVHVRDIVHRFDEIL
jgi:hypothetical protein